MYLIWYSVVEFATFVPFRHFRHVNRECTGAEPPTQVMVTTLHCWYLIAPHQILRYNSARVLIWGKASKWRQWDMLELKNQAYHSSLRKLTTWHTFQEKNASAYQVWMRRVWKQCCVALLTWQDHAKVRFSFSIYNRIHAKAMCQISEVLNIAKRN